MKTIPMIILFLVAIACSEDSPKATNQSTVTTTVSSGSWRITYYFDTDEDETSDFAGYSFTFSNSGVLTATNSTNTYPGTWSVTDSNSNDDSLNDLHFNILFPSPASFEDLSDDWEILENSASKIKLIDVSGGGGGTDYLTFEKN